MTSTRRWALGSAVAVTWLFLLVVTIPGTFSDQGIYASTAELMLRGHGLYVEVWDNKDPLFYYLNAMARAGSPLLVIPLELGWLAIVSVSAWLLAEGLPAPGRLAVAWIAVPIVVTGLRYDPGNTELPGVALALLAISLVLRGRHIGGGAVLGLLALTKLIFVPVVALAGVVVLARRRQVRGEMRALAAAASVTVAGIALMAARGELGGYATMLGRNVAYAASPDGTASFLPVRLLGNLAQATPPGIIAACLVGIALLLVPTTRLAGADRDADLVAVGAASFLGVGVVLAVTGNWPHHGTAWAIPLVVTAIRAATVLPRLLAGATPWRRWGIAAILVCLLSSWTPVALLHAAQTAVPRYRSLLTVSPEGLALARLGEGDTYARVGSNSDLGHAYGLGSWRLGCPEFHQYYFQPYSLLKRTLDCLPSVDTVVIAPDAVPKSGADDWNRYLAEVDALMGAEFRCLVADEDVRVCVKR